MGKVDRCVPAPESHHSVRLGFFPEFSRIDGVKGVGPPGAWRVGLEDLPEEEAPVRITESGGNSPCP